MAYDGELLGQFQGLIGLRLGADQSPQRGYQCMCMREESFVATPSQFEFGPVASDFSFCSRRHVPSLIGLGKGIFPDISHKLCNSILLVVVFAVDLYRKCVRTWFVDQSKESKFAIKLQQKCYTICAHA